MCRTAGRRCEEHWTPEQKAADNARRRAIYASKKGNAVSTPLEGSLAAKTAGSATNSFGIITSTPNSHIAGENKDFYTADTLSGQIDRASLHEDSFWEYGFDDPEQYSTYAPDQLDLDVEKMKEDAARVEKAARNSNYETTELAYDERIALNVFTSSEYRHINRLFFDSPRASNFDKEPDPPASKFKVLTHPFNSKENNAKLEACNEIEDVEERVARLRAINDAESEQYRNSTGIEDEEPLTKNRFVADVVGSRFSSRVYTEHSMREYTEVFDRAFTKASGEQRIVYRGEDFDADRFQESNLTLSQYLEEKYPVGSQQLMKGAQSTTMDKETAYSYAGGESETGIIYEMRSASGINITELSNYDNEQEVLLPRNTRYVVVGSRTVTTSDGAQKGIVQLVEVDEHNNIRTKDNLRKEGEFGELNWDRLQHKKEVY